MNILILSITVGMLFATGTYLILRRHPIKLILGLALLSHAVNLLIFSTGLLKRGLPPIIADKSTFAGDISAFVDPLPQALILTAIVISFGITAFVVVLVNRRNALTEQDMAMVEPSARANDPFSGMEHFLTGLDADPEDYEWLEYETTQTNRG